MSIRGTRWIQLRIGNIGWRAQIFLLVCLEIILKNYSQNMKFYENYELVFEPEHILNQAFRFPIWRGFHYINYYIFISHIVLVMYILPCLFSLGRQMRPFSSDIAIFMFALNCARLCNKNHISEVPSLRLASHMQLLERLFVGLD